ncbi:flagellar basal body-associated FliL family protein [Palleronia abyssalis]|uniref:Flagellar protein FliL n=1 Tax=Palleronia abyssalis TaxID=1501240 RepID=A0A2R8BWV8_9RHOB|nr:flagellar basal body-associated FliL family protein [Palleronia abyssalis]SPJ24644.1 hypothetical protein PAA8504_02481 [Palleronia abyssalis]
MGKILPLIIALIGLGGGVGAGIALRPDPTSNLPDVASSEAPCGPVGTPDNAVTDPQPIVEEPAEGIFFELGNQFVIPVLDAGRVDSLVVVSLTLEIAPEIEAAVAEREPRLRDRFLRVMLDHANTGGFDGAFTSNGAIDRLKKSLEQTAKTEVGTGFFGILLTDIGKQEA